VRKTEAPIGMFDSGVGGLSILREVSRLLPREAVVYFADQAHVPYGPRPMEEIQGYSRAITAFLLERSAKLIVVACNTASAAALRELRLEFPGVPFVGMEPAVKPAAATSLSRVVGVLATPATFQGALFASVVERFARDVEVIEQTLPGLVECVEDGDLDGPGPRSIVERGLQPLLQRGVDTLVLACTHYPLLIPLIREIAGPEVNVIDPSPAIARQTARLLDGHGLATQEAGKGEVTYVSTGDAEGLASLAARLIEVRGTARGAAWDEDGTLSFVPPA
jgi:glutamate racemase